MKPVVLIGFADALAAIESAWCLADCGFEVCAFARPGTRPALGRIKQVRVFPVTAPEADALACAADLGRLIAELGPAAVLPLDDHAVWLADRWAQQDPGSSTILAGPAGKLAELALDKRQQLASAATAGFVVPVSADTAEVPPGPGPWMVKPALAVQLVSGRLRQPVGRVAGTAAEVRQIAERIGRPALVQPLIEGTGEGVFGIVTGSGIAAVSAHRRVRMMNPRGSGSSACRSIPLASDLIGPVAAFLSGCDWRGLFMVEVLRDRTGRPWFMELNGRTWGSMALARHRGLAYPGWAVRAALDPAFVPPYPGTAGVTVPDVTARHLGREIVHLGMVLARGGAPRARTVREVLTPHRGDRWYNWRPGEPAVFVADTWSTVCGQLHRPGRKR
jgi:biotin carboxylase